MLGLPLSGEDNYTELEMWLWEKITNAILRSLPEKNETSDL